MEEKKEIPVIRKIEPVLSLEEEDSNKNSSQENNEIDKNESYLSNSKVTEFGQNFASVRSILPPDVNTQRLSIAPKIETRGDLVPMALENIPEAEDYDQGSNEPNRTSWNYWTRHKKTWPKNRIVQRQVCSAIILTIFGLFAFSTGISLIHIGQASKRHEEINKYV